jgi:ADP-heptose:LPS heptosyltransferase
MTPALRSLKTHFPECALHVLVAEEAAPVLEHLPWLERVWKFPRARGKAKLSKSWPLIQALRREHFDRSVDFRGNDRGALISRLCGAPERLALLAPGGFWGRRFCYTQAIGIPQGCHASLENLRLLSAWGVSGPACPELEIRANPALSGLAECLLARQPVLCHINASKPANEWPIQHWAELYRTATTAGHHLAFSAGPSSREQALLAGLKAIAPNAHSLPIVPDLATFLAVLQRARLVVCGDTGPLHFAAGLGVPTISLFGPSSPKRYAPLGKQHRMLQGGHCTCGSGRANCLNPIPCMAAISVEAVLGVLSEMLSHESL